MVASRTVRGRSICVVNGHTDETHFYNGADLGGTSSPGGTAYSSNIDCRGEAVVL